MNDNFESGIKETIKSSKKYVVYVVLSLFFLYLISGVFSISQSEIGIVLRCGKIVHARVMPGIHLSFPFPIDEVYKIPIKTVKRITIKDFSGDYNEQSLNEVKEFLKKNNDLYYYQKVPEPYCITGDNNIVNVGCSLQYSISDPVKYLQYLKNSEKALHEVANNAILHSFSSINIDKALTYGKREIVNSIKERVQEKLDSIESGLSVTFVELEKVNPPVRTRQYFNDLINAKIDKKKMLSESEAYHNEKLPEANAIANEMIERAHSYSKDVTSKAEGDSERFIDIHSTYKKSRRISRKKMYLDYLKEILSKIDEFYIVSNDKNVKPASLKLFKGINQNK